MPEETRRIYADVFQLIDSNRDGLICATELQKAFAELGYKASMEQATKMVEAVDENEDGMIDFAEFLSMVERSTLWAKPQAEEEILSAFKIFDINEDGMISMQELQKAMAAMGQPLSRKEANEMLKAMDENGDGLISYREFVNSWRQMMATIANATS